MEDIAFSDWPGQPVDFSSENNPWLPAYGFQTPSTLLDNDDFNGNPDAEYFLQATSAGQFMYLETIHEETSDDLRSENEVDSQESPMGWLASDSDYGSVICVDRTDDIGCDSDREVACPAKRRKQECIITFLNEENDLNSLSRSSSLLQFETLEKQCQETRSNSPSVHSQFSADSLETNNRKNNFSPDSLNSLKNDSMQDETNIHKMRKIDLANIKTTLSGNGTKSSESDSSDSDVLFHSSRSSGNYNVWRSFDNLPIVNKSNNIKEKISAENLSEDSGYSDNISKSLSSNNVKEKCDLKIQMLYHLEKKPNVFSAYDGNLFQEHIGGNFGISYQDLTVFKDVHLSSAKRPFIIEHFMKMKNERRLIKDFPATVTNILNLEIRLEECGRSLSNFKTSSCSEPNLFQTNSSQSDLIYVSSVPKDLNFISDFQNSASSDSIATKNLNLAFLKPENFHENNENLKYDAMEHRYKREGSYAEAMANRVDLSDDENSLYNRNRIKLPKTPIIEFDKRVLKAISEQSIQDVINSNQNLNEEEAFTSTPISFIEKRSIASTPNLAASNQFEPVQRYYEGDRRKSVENLRRKSSLTIKSSTSTSGMSDNEEKAHESIKSFGSNNSRGVHFSPVVSEVNWRDSSISTVTPDRESVYSFGSSSPERKRTPTPPKDIGNPRGRLGTPVGRSHSQPALNEDDCRKEFVDSLRNLREDLSKSQPNVGKLKRRGSQLIKKDKDGSVISAYVDRDGIQYKHTHLDFTVDFGHMATETPPSITPTINERINPMNKPKQSSSGAFHKPVVDVMSERNVAFREADRTQHQRKDKKHSSKLGGFFSRLASFRFSLKKGAEEKDKHKKKNECDYTTGVSTLPTQRVATKDDYIHIPLKGPINHETSRNINNNMSIMETATTKINRTDGMSSHRSNTNPTSLKPPLPKQPPRVVHASVKKNQNDGDAQHRHRRRQTIDSSSGTGGGSFRPMEPMGLIETDIDTEVTVITSGANVKTTRSLLDLVPEPRFILAPQEQRETSRRPHKSMEFLLDKENLKVVEPPENELRKGERNLSEHQLRVQRSLQKLTIPDWYKQSQIPREGFILKKQSLRETRWTGTGNKTTSLNSLTSNLQSPLILSTSPLSQPFVRWSTSKLNSTASSPCGSTRSSFNIKQPSGSISPTSVRSSFSYRPPYMGWRSQEKLNKPRTPAERLACSILSPQTNSNIYNNPQESPEIQSSIKEVTSAIVHYVSGLRPDEARDRSYESQETASQRSSSVSPKGSQKFCWVESSFVGTKPLDSPQTPVTILDHETHNSPTPPISLRLNLFNHNELSLLQSTSADSTLRSTPKTATLEDVLGSLLGLPSTERALSPSIQVRRHVNGVS